MPGWNFADVWEIVAQQVPDAPAQVQGDRRITWAEHDGDRFVAGVEDGPVWSTQFHPEKSGDAGAVLMANWVDTLR